MGARIYTQSQLASGSPITLLEALVLEEIRRKLGLSAHDRDRVLFQAGLRSDHFNPAVYVAYRDERLIMGACRHSGARS